VVLTKQHKIALGVFFIFCCFTSCFYFFFIHGQEDQSAVSELTNRSESQNGWVNLVFLSDLIVYKVLDLFFPVCSIFLTGIFLILGISANRLGIWFLGSIAIIVLSVLFGFATSVPELGGTVG
jgi:S-DNA-T family DNA segregation ATPase FtsK/SpoIIIE